MIHRSSLRKSTAWSCVDKRAVAFSVWTGRGMLLHKPLDPSQIPRRRYGMLVARAVRGMLKIRYLLLGGAVGGGMTLNKVTDIDLESVLSEFPILNLA